MKLRAGFVSNSSSSSFCLFGIRLSTDKAMKLAIGKENADGKVITEDMAYEDPSTAMEILLHDTDLEFVDDYEGETIYIGRSFNLIGDKETGGEFKKSVKDGLKKLLVSAYNASDVGLQEGEIYG